MMELDEIREELKERVEDLNEKTDILRVDILRQLDAAKDTAVLIAIRELNTRLAAIEARLPEPEDDEN